MEVGTFIPTLKEGRLYGRGACDTKGSLAAFLFAVGEAARRPAALRYNIVFAAVADEEFLFTGAREAAARGLCADFGIAGEPTRLRIVRAHKGVTRWKIHSEGRAAHSAYPERGNERHLPDGASAGTPRTVRLNAENLSCARGTGDRLVERWCDRWGAGGEYRP